MGQKVNPIGFRIGVIRDADSKWYADKQYAEFLKEDYVIRKTIKKRKGFDNAAISKIEIERQAQPASCDPAYRQAWYHHRTGWRGHRYAACRSGEDD